MQDWLRERIDALVDALVGIFLLALIALAPVSTAAKAAGVLVLLAALVLFSARWRTLRERESPRTDIASEIDAATVDPRLGGLEIKLAPPPAIAPSVLMRKANPVPASASAEAPLGRNDPCWCGSGKKYKRCHGA